MLHLLSTIVSLLLLAGIGALVVEMLRRDFDRIVDALLGQPPQVAPRPWQARVRMVGAARPAAVSLSARRAA